MVILQNPKNQTAAFRSQCYVLFCEIFSYPDSKLLSRIEKKEWRQDFFGSMRELNFLDLKNTEILPIHFSEISPGTYSELFDGRGSSPRVSLLERRYVDLGEQELWKKLLAFYTHFGLDFSEKPAFEQPDHLLTQTAFMHYLSFMEAGSEESAEDLRRGQRDFLQEHLCNWLPYFCENLKVEHEVGNRAYFHIAQIFCEFVREDLGFLEKLIVS